MTKNRNYGKVSGMAIILVGNVDYDANDAGRNEAIQAVIDYFQRRY